MDAALTEELRNKVSPRNRNNKTVREENKKKIIEIVGKFEPTGIDTILNQSALSYPTVFSIVKELVTNGILEKSGYAASTGGRQAFLYTVCTNNNYVVGIHLYSEWFALTICDVKGRIICEKKEDALPTTYAEDKLAEILNERIGKTLVTVGLSFMRLAGICLTSPADPVTALSTPEINRVNIEKLAELLSEKTGVKTTDIHDAALLNFLERTNYALSGMKSYIHIVLEQELKITVYNKSTDQCEIMDTFDCLGHTTVVPDGLPCECGLKGCVLTYCNGIGLYEDYCKRRPTSDGAPVAFENMKHNGVFISMLMLARKKDTAAMHALDKALRILAIALANAAKTLGVYNIVLSGFFTSNDADYHHALEKYTKENIPALYAEKTKLISGMALLDDCSHGACLFLCNNLFPELDNQRFK